MCLKNTFLKSNINLIFIITKWLVVAKNKTLSRTNNDLKNKSEKRMYLKFT
jgi:hypothetical protein